VNEAREGASDVTQLREGTAFMRLGHLVLAALLGIGIIGAGSTYAAPAHHRGDVQLVKKGKGKKHKKHLKKKHHKKKRLGTKAFRTTK
jgi:hypothetical protein